MFGKLGRAVRSAILWSYRRGSWQYDVIVAGILAFIFLTPRSLFNDQPRPPSVQQIQALQDDNGTLVFWVATDALADTPAEEVNHKLQQLLSQRTGRSLRVIDTRPTADAEGEVRAYLVYARP